MIAILKNKKGMTITEVIMALAILGIIAIPLLAVFSNSIFLTHLTKSQMEINAVMQIVKGEVVQSVKNGRQLPDFEHPEDGTKKINICPSSSPADTLYDTTGNETKFLKIDGGNLQDKYKYKVVYEAKGENTEVSNTVELLIKLYSDGGKYLNELKINVLYEISG